MAVINFTINAKDTASKTIEGVGKSFGVMKNAVETATKSVGAVGDSFLKATGTIFVIVSVFKLVQNAIRDIDEMMKKMGGESAKSWETMKKSLEAIGKLISQTVMPVIVAITRSISDFVKSANGIDILSSVVAGISASFVFFKEVLTPIYNILKDSIGKVIEDITKYFKSMNSETDNATKNMDGLKSILVGVGVAMNVIININKTLIIAFIDLIKIVMSVGDVLGKIFTGQWDKVGDSAKKTWENVKNFSSNVVNNIGDMVNEAKKTAEKLDKSIDMKKVQEKTKQAYQNAKDNAINTIKETTETQKNIIDNTESNLLQFSETLKKQYNEYVKLKADLSERNYKNEQEYFQKINKLNELSSVKGIKELDDYYKKVEQKKIGLGEVLKSINIGQYLIAGDGSIEKLTNNITSIFNNTATNIINIMQSAGTKIQKSMQTVGAGIQAVGDTIKSVMSFVSGSMEKELNNISNKWSKYFSEIEKQRDNDIKNVDKYTQELLETLGLAQETELERSRRQLDELLAIQTEGYSLETEMRLAQLEEYYGLIDEQTDKEIQTAYERQKARILEQEEIKKIENKKLIDEKQKEVKRIQIQEEAETKKRQIEDEYNKKKLEAEKKKNNELNAMEQKIFEANKATQIANVWIATGVGTAMAWASAMSMPFPANVIAGAVVSSLLLGNAIAQTVLIGQQQYTPKNFATGGVIVGEAGREMVNLPNGSTIMNNDQTERAIEKNEVTIYNDIYIDSEKIESVIMKKRINLGLRGV